MFDFLGNIQQQQEELRRSLAELEVVQSSDNGVLTITMDGNKRVKDISIDRKFADTGDHEQLEDLLVITINAAMQKADALAEQKMKEQLGNILPGGLDQLFGG